MNLNLDKRRVFFVDFNSYRALLKGDLCCAKDDEEDDDEFRVKDFELTPHGRAYLIDFPSGMFLIRPTYLKAFP